MIAVKYCKTDAGNYVGIAYFNNKPLISGGRDVSTMKRNLRYNMFHCGYRSSMYGRIKFDLQLTDIADMPLADIPAVKYKQWFNGAKKRIADNDDLPTYQHRETPDTLPELTPATGATKPSITYKVEDDQLIVYQEIARYTIG